MPENPLRLLGRYALHGEIAVGGMATVHFGRLYGAVGFSRTVAIKRLHKPYARDPDFVSMFLDEARLAARIRHPNVVPTLDVVATEGELFVVMEYVHGESLSRLIREEARQRRFIPPAVVGSILSGALHGLHAAHEARDERGEPLSIVHRDVSPQNIIVGSDGVTRVLDFGVAKAAGRIHTTRQGQVKGKLPYMAPEQLEANASLTRLVDVYAASVCLWEALTGRRLFAGESEAIVLGQLLSSHIEPPSLHAPEISPDLDDVVLRGLSRDANARFATAREMASALERAVGRVASTAEVADWMESAAGKALAARHRTVTEIELKSDPVSSEQLLHEISSMRKAPSSTPEMTPPSAMASGPTAAIPSGISVQSQLSQLSQLSGVPEANARRRPYARAVMIGAVVGLVFALIAMFGAAIEAARSRASARAPNPTHGATETAKETTSAPPAASPSGSAAPATSALGAPASATDSQTNGAESPAASAAKSQRNAGGKTPSATGNASKKNCDPPYSIESNGRKRFKPECL